MIRFPDSWWLDRPLIFAHRGASHDAPENTLQAFRRAVAVGADGIELDVHLSSDGVPVVIHNARVDGTTDGTGFVNDLSLTQLKALDAGSHFDSRFAGAQIPTLEEILAEVGTQILINIELKDQSGRAGGLERAVVDVVKHLNMQARVCFSSFKPYTLFKVRAFSSEIPCGLLYGPMSMGVKLLRPITPHEALHPHFSLISPTFVRRVHKRGLRVAAWTLDDPDLAQKFAAWGVDIIISNEPAQVLAAVQKSSVA